MRGPGFEREKRQSASYGESGDEEEGEQEVKGRAAGRGAGWAAAIWAVPHYCRA